MSKRLYEGLPVQLMIPKESGEFLMKHLQSNGINVNHKYYTDTTIFISFEIMSNADVLSIFHAGINFKNKTFNGTTV